jgi:hypothetical protein
MLGAGLLFSTLPAKHQIHLCLPSLYSFLVLLNFEVNMAVENRGPQVSGVAGFFLALSTLTILLRCYCRALVVKSFGLDDWSALVAWVRSCFVLQRLAMLKFIGFLRVLLCFCHYGGAPWNRPACQCSSTNRHTCGVEGMELSTYRGA